MKYIADFFIIAGEVLIVIGAYFVAPVAAIFTAGAVLIADGVVIGLAGGMVK
jgi:hypothetical protein